MTRSPIELSWTAKKSNNTDCYLVIVVGAQVAAVTALIPAFPEICFSQENIENISQLLKMVPIGPQIEILNAFRATISVSDFLRS